MSHNLQNESKKLNKNGVLLSFLLSLFLFSFSFTSALDVGIVGIGGIDLIPEQTTTTNASSGNVTHLSNLSDVNLSSLSNNDVLKYDSVTERWINKQISSFLGLTNDFLFWNSNDLDFNDSKLEPKYFNATQSAIIYGTVDGGTLADTQHADANYDGITFNFSEATGTPALDLRINFTNIESFNGGVMRYKTSTLSGDYPIIQLWNYDTSSWEDYPTIGESQVFSTITQPVFDDSDHLSGGIVQMRIYKGTTGKTNNHYYVDWIALSKGYGTPAGEETDPYSYHTDSNINATGYNVSADYFFGNGSQLNGVLLETDEANLNVNSSNYWDNLDTPSDINAGDITDDGTYYDTSSNINATGYNITADYYFGDGSQLTNLPSGLWTLSGSDIYRLSKVGINTTAPLSLLSNTNTNPTLGTLASDGILWASNNESGYAMIIDQANPNGAGLRIQHNGSIGLGIYDDNSAKWEIFTTDGRVGIGTSNPDTKFVVDDTDSATIYKTEWTFGGGVLNMNETNDTHYPYIAWRNKGTRGAYLGWGSPGNYIDFYLENGNDLAIRGGNVGIGTNSPAGALDVSNVFYTMNTGRVGIRDQGVTGEGGQLDLLGEGTNYDTYIDNYYGHFRVVIGGGEKLKLTSGGDLELGLGVGAYGSGRFHAKSSGDLVGVTLDSTRDWDIINIVSTATDYFAIRDTTAGAVRLAIDENGGVGIRTASPSTSAALHVYGTGASDWAILADGTVDLYSKNSKIYMAGTMPAVGGDPMCWDGTGASYIGDCSSLTEFKTNITYLNMTNNLWTKYMQMKPATYYWKNKDWEQNIQFGFLAEDMEAVHPMLADYREYINETTNETVKELSGINFNAVTTANVLAIQSLKIENEQLKAENQLIKSELCAISSSFSWC